MNEYAEEVAVTIYVLVNRWVTRQWFGTAQFRFWKGETR